MQKRYVVTKMPEKTLQSNYLREKSNKINFKVLYSKITQNYYTRDLNNYIKLQGHANKLLVRFTMYEF